MMTAAPDDDDGFGVSTSPKNDSPTSTTNTTTTTTTTVLRFVRYIESIQVPWTKSLTKSSKKTDDDDENNTNDVLLVGVETGGGGGGGTTEQQQQQQQPVYLISGLERSLGLNDVNGNVRKQRQRQAAADVVLIGGISPPRYLFYMVSGFLCDIIQFFVDAVLYHNVTKDASTCWAVSFMVSIFFRHTTHSYLVFGPYVGGYYQSLFRMYTGYSIIVVISTLFNIVMTKYLILPHIVAYIITLLWTGIVNYFILKKLWSFGGSSSVDETKKTDAEVPSATEEEELNNGTEMMEHLVSAGARKDMV